MSNKSCLYIIALITASTPSIATTITGTSLFIDNRKNDITFNNSGIKLQIEADIFDSLGVPGNIEYVRAIHSSGLTYNLGYSAAGNFHTPTYSPYIRAPDYGSVPFYGQTGQYRIVVKNDQGQLFQAFTQELTETRPLAPVRNLGVTGTDPLHPIFKSDTVSGADRYNLRVWNTEGSIGDLLYNSPVQNTPSFSLPDGILAKGGSYTFSIRALDYDASGNLERRSAVFAPYVVPNTPKIPQVQSRAGAFDPNKPTIIITHGWQPDIAEGTEVPDAGAWFYRMAENIAARPLASNPSKRFGDTHNIVTVVWSSAFGKNPYDAYLATDNVGSGLGKYLSNLMGSGYEKDIQFIGHSYGTVVNTVAAQYLGYKGIDTTQFTILDAPMQNNGLPIPIVSKSYYREVLPPNVGFVDNYYSLTGTNVCSDFNRRCAYNSNIDRSIYPETRGLRGTELHSAPHIYYLATIKDQSATDGFSYSAGASYNVRPAVIWDGSGSNNEVTSRLKFDDAWITVGSVLFDLDQAILTTSSPAGFGNSVFIPGTADFLQFEFSFREEALALLSVLIDGDVIYEFSAENVFLADEFQWTSPIDIRRFAGGFHTLTFWVDGPPDVQFTVRNVQFLTDTSDVPEPESYMVFGLAMVVALWRASRPGQRQLGAARVATDAC